MRPRDLMPRQSHKASFSARLVCEPPLLTDIDINLSPIDNPTINLDRDSARCKLIASTTTSHVQLRGYVAADTTEWPLKLMTSETSSLNFSTDEIAQTGSTSAPRSVWLPQSLAVVSARSGSIPTKSTKSRTPTPVKPSANSSAMASLSASRSPCTPAPVPEPSTKPDESADTVATVRERVPRTLECLRKSSNRDR